jgi:hypothetical protein
MGGIADRSDLFHAYCAITERNRANAFACYPTGPHVNGPPPLFTLSEGSSSRDRM